MTTEECETQGTKDGAKKAPIVEIRMIFGGLLVGGSSKSLKEYTREVNSSHLKKHLDATS